MQPGRREDALRIAQAMVRATSAEEGCRHYRFYADVDDPESFFLFEEWESDAALARHFESEHMRSPAGDPGAPRRAAPDRRYEVGSARAMG